MKFLRVYGLSTITALCALVFASCSGGGGSGGGGSITPPVTPPAGPTTSGLNVKIQEIAIPSGTPSDEIAVASDGSVYFGNSLGLLRYLNGSFTFTQPAIQEGSFDFGGEELVSVPAPNTVVWTENAFEQGSIQVYGEMECGGSGGTAALCDRSKYAAATNTHSFLFDTHGTSWAGGVNAVAGELQVAAPNTGLFFIPPGFGDTMQVTLGADGNVWAGNIELNGLSANGASALFQFALVNGQIENTKTLPLPAGDEMNGLTLGPDGRFWFTDGAHNAIGAMTLSGTVTEYPIPTVASLPNGITTGPDGALWFTETQGNNIGRIDVSGHITEYAIPSSNAQPKGIAATPSACSTRAIWFTEPGVKKIGEISLQ